MPRSRMRRSGLAVALPAPGPVPSPERSPISPGTALSPLGSEYHGVYRASSPPSPSTPRVLLTSPRTPYSDEFATPSKAPSPVESLALLPEPQGILSFPDVDLIPTPVTSLALLPQPQGILSFPDGDLILQSNEGDDFGVHLDVLQSVSSYFDEDGYSKAQQSPGPDVHTRRIHLSTGTLDLLLRFLYPSRSPPSIESTERAISLMQAAADLKIQCSWIDNAITSYLSLVPHPLRAWAIAARFGYAGARREAARRFFKTNEDFYDDVPMELEHVNARQFMELQRVKTRAVAMARDAINKVEWACDGCWQSWNPNEKRPWKSQFLGRVSGLNPFSYDATSEVAFELSMVRGGCGHCPISFASEEAEKARTNLRAQLGEILRNIE